MQNAELMTDNSDSQDGPTNINPTAGYYDAVKCRAHIANQLRVSKIDRFVVQVNKAVKVETDMHSQLASLLNMFQKRSAQVAYDFTLKCKLGSQRHRQDRILNQTKKSAKRQQYRPPATTPPVNISNDLLYGQGAQLVHELLNQPMLFVMPKNHIKKSRIKQQDTGTNNTEESHVAQEFEPSLFVDMLEDSIRNNMKRSKAIMNRLITLRQLFKSMATEHRDKVDIVYAAEEERQASTVIRRSAYNLSVAAIKATSTPMST